VLAAWTIQQTKSQAKKSQDALLLERQVEFRLGLLKEIASANRLYNDDDMRLRAAMLPPDLIPLTRAFLGLESTQRAEGHLASLRAARLVIRDVIADEFPEAVSTSLSLEVSPQYHERSRGGIAEVQHVRD
jgi:hypothetical protein